MRFVRSLFPAFMSLVASSVPAVCMDNVGNYSFYDWTAECQPPYYFTVKTPFGGGFQFSIRFNLGTGTVSVTLLFISMPTELQKRSSIPLHITIPRRGWTSYLTRSHEFTFQLNESSDRGFSTDITQEQARELLKAWRDTGDENGSDTMSLNALEWSATTPLLVAEEAVDWLKSSKCVQ